MIQNIRKRLFRKLAKRVLAPNAQLSYSQFGEDLIISHLFALLGIAKPTYLDIGANEPKYISNTYFFYERGSTGVLIEPNPHLFRKLQAQRPRDIVLNTGIGMNNVTEADFYLFPNKANGLSTFSKKEADHWVETGMKGLGKIAVEKVIKMPLIPVNTILEKHFPDHHLNLISLDVEGLDLEILKSLNFSKFKPDVICVETLGYDDNQESYKLTDIINYMLTKDYEIYADTRVNTIFCRKDLFKK
ncbi:MAG: SAM-dependent methyltransferase [Segetibacter sp.]|jgi:FkbM family methyltransferase|nr:SAM-dependent methyltransferase [Segetibacter sp.]